MLNFRLYRNQDLNYFYPEFIRQLPGPISLLVKFNDPIGSFIIVTFEIPPIFKIHKGNSIFNLLAIS